MTQECRKQDDAICQLKFKSGSRKLVFTLADFRDRSGDLFAYVSGLQSSLWGSDFNNIGMDAYSIRCTLYVVRAPK